MLFCFVRFREPVKYRIKKVMPPTHRRVALKSYIMCYNQVSKGINLFCYACHVNYRFPLHGAAEADHRALVLTPVISVSLPKDEHRHLLHIRLGLRGERRIAGEGMDPPHREVVAIRRLLGLGFMNLVRKRGQISQSIPTTCF